MKKIFLVSIALVIAFFTMRINFTPGGSPEGQKTGHPAVYSEISGTVGKGETLFDIFNKYGLDLKELFKMQEAAADIHRLKDVCPEHAYTIVLDRQEQIASFTYWISDDTFLEINNTDSGYCAEKRNLTYEKRIENISGVIKDNLVSSLGQEKNGLLLALKLSDIFAWDIDFTTDLRNDDTYKIAVEGLYIDGAFRKYGEILATEFVNNGDTYEAYQFENNGKSEYYDGQGKSLRKAFLKAPLNFRRISSFFSRGRVHPILKINRPHNGLDYAAPQGTPVSVTGDGNVIFSGRQGQYGKLIIVKHPNGYRTYYGHLSKIAKSVRRGSHVTQGEVIGYVGATGLATGPHLHYEMRINTKPVNPLSVKIPHGTALTANLMAGFTEFKRDMDARFASANFSGAVLAQNKKP